MNRPDSFLCFIVGPTIKFTQLSSHAKDTPACGAETFDYPHKRGRAVYPPQVRGDPNYDGQTLGFFSI